MDRNGRLLIVANRLPLSVAAGSDGPRIEPNAGGLATGLRGPHEAGAGLWFGWAGNLPGRTADKRRALQLLRDARFVPIELSKAELEGYYDQISNGVLWPTFHYLLDRLPLEMASWDTYRAINRRFADEVAARWRPGDLIWVHDFHLMLVPQLLRERLPDARIGFFLHVPFPSSEVFRVLPWRAELLQGLLGADLIGFHTLGYLRHFAASLLRILGLEVAIDRVDLGSRQARLTALPMGIEVDTFDALADEPDVLAEAARLRMQSGGAKLLVGIDRLDYTKGLPRRMLAFERLLDTRSADAPPVQLVQVAVTSRHNVSEYKRHKREVDELVGRINGRFGTQDYTPIRYINSSLDARAVTALYRAADVMVVTPLRDGLNLVAKEFVAARKDGDGVLVLSEFAGVANEMPEALKVHPYDTRGTAEVFAAALTLPEAERRRRMTAMRAAVRHSDVHAWVRTFLGELANGRRDAPRAPRDQAALVEALGRARDERPLSLFLDYDGTLVGFAPRPELATPDRELLDLLEQLAAADDLHVHVVSGRPREFLEHWFGPLPVGLHGEHGLVSRLPGATNWSTAPTGSVAWQPRVLALLRRFSAQVPGSLVETKAQSVAFHFRQVDAEFAASVVKEMHLYLLEMLSQYGASVISGNRVLEIRPMGIHKGNIITRVMAGPGNGTAAVILGDDRTDEDMFAAAPDDALTVHVGVETTAARYRIADFRAARSVLQSLLVGQDARR